EASGNFLISDRSGAVLRLDATSGNVTIVAQNGAPDFLLYRPEDLVLGSDGFVYVLEDLDITRVDPVTGAQILVTPQHRLLGASGMKFGTDGKLYVANKNWGAVVWVNSGTGDQNFVSQDGFLVNPLQLDFQQDGSLLVSNWDFNTSELLRINPNTGAQSTIVAGLDTTAIPGMARDGSGGG